MWLNRNMSNTVMFGPVEFGGMEFPEVYTLQDQVQIPYLLKQLRWDKTVANNALVTLNNLQMVSGFVLPLFQTTAQEIEYVGHSHYINLDESG